MHKSLTTNCIVLLTAKWLVSMQPCEPFTFTPLSCNRSTCITHSLCFHGLACDDEARMLCGSSKAHRARLITNDAVRTQSHRTVFASFDTSHASKFKTSTYSLTTCWRAAITVYPDRPSNHAVHARVSVAIRLVLPARRKDDSKLRLIQTDNTTT